jgi:heme/copper-type cytochrome/quinol oxidase subunit 3
MVEKSGYLGLMAKIFLFMVFLIGAIASAYFGIVGLLYSQAVVEVDVLGDRYKYECLTDCDDPTIATYNTSDELASFTTYQALTSALNAKVTAFLAALTIVFSLLGLYVLMQVVEEIKQKKKTPKQDMY